MRDTDNPALTPVSYIGGLSIGSQASSTITTVPAGKRLVVENISYVASAPNNGTQLVYAVLSGGQQLRAYLPINPPHAGGNSTLSLQDGSVLTKVYFEAGEIVVLSGSGNSYSAMTLSVILTGYLITP